MNRIVLKNNVPLHGPYEACEDQICCECRPYRSLSADQFKKCQKRCIQERSTDIQACCESSCGQNELCKKACAPMEIVEQQFCVIL